MIEKVILDFLTDNLDVPVYMEVPEDVPQENFVILEKTGSSVENHIYSAMFALQSYGPDLLAAASLNDIVKGVMDRLIELNEICSCKLNSDYNFTDTRTKRYRYQAIYDIVHY